ncbi:sensor histidine kinase [Clostridium sp. YIM B02505]|uniref:histidine kinase n=1 Tax=Clostridium yunnanense TaxID=2800325 RepID=A0ABS1ER78_9CLOT|nr:sensor histidine kinase [Clostridium yunnanense]MBK1811818.1 sensor histidine kinase [Clostridium yunnanense]
MSFFRYLKESLRFLVFYVILLSFILLSIYVDRSNKVLTSNLVYMITVSIVMLMFFILYDYTVKNKNVKNLKEAQKSEDKTPIFTEAFEYKDEIYQLIISDLYNEYVESLRNIEDSFSENSEFIISWVHEIKTPITTAKLILDTMNFQEQQTVISLKEELAKIDDHVEKVLYYSRSNDFSKDYVISETIINNVVKESVKKHSIIFIRKHISFLNKIDDKLTADTDKKWLAFIIDQIVSNALKYTKEGGKISFYTTKNYNEIVLTIEDNGIGISREDIDRIFSKSFTGNNGRDNNIKATGMGLYLAKKLSTKLGHRLTVESEYGKGTKFHIYFPLYGD